MKRLALLGFLALSTCAGEDANGNRGYDNNDLQLAVGNGALNTCTCLFVMEMPEEYCRAWVKASPNVAALRIDTNNKNVVSTAFITWSARAHFVDERHGCVLE